MSDYGGSTTPPEHRDSWMTPPEVFAVSDAEFSFAGDAAASDSNRLHENYLTERQDSLSTDWMAYFGSGTVWCNPPYSDISPWVEKANNEAKNGVGTVMLLPVDTSVGWFKLARSHCTEVRFITGGRLAFISAATGKPVSGNNKGSMFIIWNSYQPSAGFTGCVDRDSLITSGKALLSSNSAAA
ncbi:phage N-6-adenine-methyltransferase [Pantoea ananatis]|uniref:phage N-6-adenine-methyltransferase n=1 Tax=Pantoea ananas TaxID=553 RepID=UPI001B31145D|nr:phage N-6-adenine-methyltransferase [Pantoea ananatis]